MENREMLIKATEEARAKGMLNVLKSECPQHNWAGTITFDILKKECVFSGFTKEENEIISRVRIE